MTVRNFNVPWIAVASVFGAGLLIGGVVGKGFSAAARPGGDENSESARAKIGQARAETDTASRKDEAAKLVLGNIMTVPFQELYGVLASRPPAELTELAQQLKALPPGHDRDQKIVTFFKAWAHLDAKGAMAAAASFENPSSRDKAISAVIEGADPASAAYLANAIAALPLEALAGRRQRGLIGMAATKWSELDPAAAAKFVDTFPATPGDYFADVHTIAANWAAADPQAALAWAQQRDGTNSFPTHFATSGAISGWWQKDAGAAEAYVASHLSTLSDRQMASSLASQMFNSDPRHAMEWVNGLPDVQARQQADSTIAIQIGWSDPKGAAVWASNLPDDVRGLALNSSVEHWAQGEPAAAAQWLNSLNGTSRDQAVSGYSSAISRTDPANALGWAVTITDPAMRNNSVDRIARTWIYRNPTEAKAWLQGSALSDEQKKRLFATAVPPGG